MRWVEHAPIRPQRCAVLPYIGSSNSQKGFIDTGAELPGFDNHVYISVIAVEQMAAMVGWHPASTLHAVQADRDKLAEKVAGLEADLAAASERLRAVQVLKQAGYQQAKRPGRPRKETSNA